MLVVAGFSTQPPFTAKTTAQASGRLTCRPPGRAPHERNGQRPARRVHRGRLRQPVRREPALPGGHRRHGLDDRDRHPGRLPPVRRLRLLEPDRPAGPPGPDPRRSTSTRGGPPTAGRIGARRRSTSSSRAASRPAPTWWCTTPPTRTAASSTLLQRGLGQPRRQPVGELGQAEVFYFNSLLSHRRRLPLGARRVPPGVPRGRRAGDVAVRRGRRLGRLRHVDGRHPRSSRTPSPWTCPASDPAITAAGGTTTPVTLNGSSAGRAPRTLGRVAGAGLGLGLPPELPRRRRSPRPWGRAVLDRQRRRRQQLLAGAPGYQAGYPRGAPHRARTGALASRPAPARERPSSRCPRTSRAATRPTSRPTPIPTRGYLVSHVYGG